MAFVPMLVLFGPTATVATASRTGTNSTPTLAATPPMGWNDWYTFQCNINEGLIIQSANAMVASGMKAAGYQYVNMDDCWMGPQRDANGNLQGDPIRFPHGIKWLADYIH